jgi:hypothetical protein
VSLDESFYRRHGVLPSEKIRYAAPAVKRLVTWA